LTAEEGLIEIKVRLCAEAVCRWYSNFYSLCHLFTVCLFCLFRCCCFRGVCRCYEAAFWCEQSFRLL